MHHMEQNGHAHQQWRQCKKVKMTGHQQHINKGRNVIVLIICFKLQHGIVEDGTLDDYQYQSCNLINKVGSAKNCIN